MTSRHSSNSTLRSEILRQQGVLIEAIELLNEALVSEDDERALELREGARRKLELF